MWNSFVKNVGVLATVATLVGGAIAFFAQRSDDLAQRRLQAEAAQRESKKVFLEKQADLFFEAVPLVSKLAIAPTPDAMTEKDQLRFWELFWGELGMVEDVSVARSMDLFGRSLQAFRDSGPDNACAEQRKSISLTLSHCVRKSLGANWGVDFGAGNGLDWCTDDRFAALDLACQAGTKGEPEPDDPKRPSRAN
jgi:hypothetical protein